MADRRQGLVSGAPIPLNLGTQSNPGLHPHAGVARLVNCYAVAAGEEGKTAINLTADDGLEVFSSDTATGEGRGLIVLGNTLYAISGNSVHSVDTTGTASVIGAMPSTGHVAWAVNRQQPFQEIMLACDGLPFRIQNNTFYAIDNAALEGPTGVTFLDGFLITNSPRAVGRYQWSGIDDATSWDGADFASAETNPDPLVGVATMGQVLVLAGTRSTEWHQPTTDTNGNFTFSRVNATGFGCMSARTIRKVSIVTKEKVTETVGWIACDGQGEYSGVILLEDYSARRISNEALDRVIAAEPDKSLIRATSWVNRGHGFYAISGTGWTWVYDTATQLWHERESIGDDGQPTHWKVAHVISFNGSLIAQDRDTGALYRMAHDIYDEADSDLVVTIQPPPLHAYPQRLQIDAVWLDIVPGVGLIGRPWGGADSSEVTADESLPTADESYPDGYANTYPQVSMSLSRDGKTWGDEMLRDIGRTHESQRRIYWRQLGTFGSHGVHMRFRASAAVMKTFLGAYWEGRKLRA